MNTPYYLMTQQDKEYLLRGEEFLRNLLKTRVIDFSINEIKAAGYTCPDYRSLYLLGRDLPPVPAIYFLFNQAGGIYYIGQSVNVFKRICSGHTKTMGRNWTKLSILGLKPGATQEQLNYAEAMFIFIHQHKRSRNKHGKTLVDMSFKEVIHRFDAQFEETIFPIALLDIAQFIEYWQRNEALFQK